MNKPSSPAPKLLTAGYEGLDLLDLVRLAHHLDAQIVDIRHSPRSRKPAWNRADLQAVLGDRYVHVPELGNTAHGTGRIAVADMDAGLARVRAIERPWAVLFCACREFNTCHRWTVHHSAVTKRGGMKWFGDTSTKGMRESPFWDAALPAAACPFVRIPTLSMTQPWATLAALGEKRIETRSWATTYRGPVAVHASRGFPSEDKARCASPIFKESLARHGITDWRDLPLGQIIAVGKITDCQIAARSGSTAGVPTHADRTQRELRNLQPWVRALSEQERAFGLFWDPDETRYGWFLAGMRPFQSPIARTGALGLWDAYLPGDALDALSGASARRAGPNNVTAATMPAQNLGGLFAAQTEA